MAGVPNHIQTLHEGEELVRRILDAVPGGVVHVARDGSIRSANPDALRRRLAVLARTDEKIDWEARRVLRTPARVQDDCAIGVLLATVPS